MGNFFARLMIKGFWTAFMLFIFYIIIGADPETLGFIFILGLLSVPLVTYLTHDEILKEAENELKKNIVSREDELRRENQDQKNITDLQIKNINKQLRDKEKEVKTAIEEKEYSEQKEKLWKQTLIEKSSGFPSLINYLEKYESYYDGELANHLENKKHPAYKASELIKEESLEKRKARKEARIAKAIIEYYENIAPFLTDFKNEIPSAEDEALFEEGYSDEERQDPSSNYLTVQEYKKLTPSERNQRALDRFWKRNKSNWLIGRLYERFVGYSYEQEGYFVEYVGAINGKEDLGRDLICKKGKEIVVIQCKNWAKFKTLHEKHIFQFFGTVFEYRENNPGKNVRAVFYCTTVLSELAKKFAKKLDVEIIENHNFDQSYPCIKCNISHLTGEKIYHLPFDQQYDKIVIEPKTGEFYCKTVAQAESKGFRRAYRWKGIKN